MTPTPDDGAQAISPISDADRWRTDVALRVMYWRGADFTMPDEPALRQADSWIALFTKSPLLTAETAAREKAEKTVAGLLLTMDDTIERYRSIHADAASLRDERDAAIRERDEARRERDARYGLSPSRYAELIAAESREQAALAEVGRMRAEKDGAYTERNALVCALSKLFPSWLGLHDMTDLSWDPEWHNIVFTQLPTGQASWHIHDRELPMFAHLKRGDGQWDGHTTDEKYRRIAALAANPEAKTRAEHWHERDDEARRNDATAQPKESPDAR